jgi:3-hydroxyacyl-CoA dehydrogenase
MQAAGDEALVASGRLGRKNGKGFYEYEDGKRGEPSAEAYAALRVSPPERSEVPLDVIVERLVLPMVNEAAYCLEEDVVSGPAKLDLAMIFGTGFPPFRGGLLRHADALKADRVLARLSDLTERLGSRFTPAQTIRRLAGAGEGFYSAGGAASHSPEAGAQSASRAS